ncbi:hypothetical protein ACHAW5_009060 [Stephanodiscus triporus]|uniref:Uncharacterized protein n=1 Tax=Stephanodiscus triporus TaxID=2934178 RepID=A0ABD3PAJ6_9STRA
MMTPGTSSSPPTAETPLISPEEAREADGRTTTMESTPFKNEDHDDACPSSSNNNNNNEHELRFYDPAAILDVSRELAFGYLILLTGGAVDYVGPVVVAEGDPSSSTTTTTAAARRESQSPRPSSSSTDRDASLSSSSSSATTFEEESSSLAYAAIVDGNVLHACFGLKAVSSSAAANGRSSIPTIGGGGENGRRSSRSVFFCCFPSSSGAMDALHLALPRLSRNNARMQNLVDVLREVRDLDHEEASRGSVAAAYATAGATMDATTTAKQQAPLYVRVVRAYVTCFAAVVRYHDAREIINKNDDDDDDAVDRRGKAGRPRGGIVVRCSGVLAKCFGKTKTNPKHDTLRKDALGEIAIGFRGLREDIWQGLENMATESAITTGLSSVEGSTT